MFDHIYHGKREKFARIDFKGRREILMENCLRQNLILLEELNFVDNEETVGFNVEIIHFQWNGKRDVEAKEKQFSSNQSSLRPHT